MVDLEGTRVIHPSNSNHHHSTLHRSDGSRFFKNEKLMWVLLGLVSVLPVVLLLLKLCRKASERYESRTGRRRHQHSRTNDLTEPCHRHSNHSNTSVFTITKQDYSNMAPPRYSIISSNPVLSTYEKPPPYTINFVS